MKNSQLLEALRSLSKTEFREFGKFVNSPFFNNRSEVVRFFEAIKKFYPAFLSEGLSEEKIFRAVYPGKKYSVVLMRKLVSLTINLLMEYFTETGFRESKLEYNLKLIEMLRIRKLTALFEKKVKIVDELFENSEHSFAYYESKYKYTTLLNWHMLIMNEKSAVHKLQNEIDDFIEYFLSVSLLLYLRLGEWSRGFNIKFDLKFYDEVIRYVSVHKAANASLAVLYYNMLMMLETEDEKYFFELQKCRDEFAPKINRVDDYNVSIVLMQYCHKRVIKGDTQYRKYQFEITKSLLERDMIPPGHIEPYFFTNTVRNASAIKEFDWSENFVSEYKGRLKPELAGEIVDYSLAMIEFYREDFEKSLKYLSKINIERSNMKLDIKNLLIIIYYELEYTEELISLIDAYKHFLHRDKSLSEQHKAGHVLFVNLVSDLVKIKHGPKNKSAVKLKNEIEKSPYFSLKAWLMKKAEELS